MMIVKGVIVTFDKDYMYEDADVIINAISLLKGVASVDISELEHSDIMNRMQLKHQVVTKLHTAINDAFKGSCVE
jgi:hypothetical protein